MDPRPLEETLAAHLDQHDCPLCHQLFVDPVHTPCRHTFCAFCLGRWLDVAKAGARNMEDAEEEEQQQTCPMCRAQLQPAALEHDPKLVRCWIVISFAPAAVGVGDAWASVPD